MGKLYIAEYPKIGKEGTSSSGVRIQCGLEPALVNAVDITPASKASPPFASIPKTSLIFIRADSACRYVIGATPVANADSMPMDAGESRYLCVQSGHKIAVIAR